jgi:outer membrane protein TolC
MGVCLLLTTVAQAQISLYTAVDLARRNSSAVRTAEADVERAKAGLSEARDVYVPSASVGSSLGYSYGFPVGQPTLFNAQAQSLVLSFSQPDYVRSARAAAHTAALRLEDALDQVELDAAVDYAQLNTVTEELAALDQQQGYAKKLATIAEDRLSAGVESQIAATRAELIGAQADLRRLDLMSQARVLRQRLANLTGLYVDVIETEPESMPKGAPEEDRSRRQMLASVDAASSDALSKRYIAHGDDRQIFRPQLGFGINYQRFDTSINDYNYYYAHPLQSNNLSVGVQLTIPLFDASRQAKARESAADAAHSNAQAEQAREDAGEQTLQLDSGLATLRAQARVAGLQWKLSQEQLQAVILETANPPVAPGARALTPQDEMEARIEERARYSDSLDAQFSLLKAQLSLLRVTRELDAWVNHGAH